MILVKLHEGLSNQMFQYAAARRLAALHGTSVRIDTSWYDNIPAGSTPRTYQLHHLQITGTRASRWESIGTDGLRNTPPLQIPVALYRKARPRYRFVGERHFHFDPEVLSLPDNVCLYGYWVSENYFADAAEVIRREYRFRSLPAGENEKYIAWITETESVALHVRRGDYVTNPANTAIQGVCDTDYYRRCIDLMRQRVPNASFFVFSDDLDWARDNLPLTSDVEYVGHNTGEHGLEDLRLMSAATHNIIANSGFSWWAAWLNPNEQKIVMAPKIWMRDTRYNTRDVVPSTWVSV